MAKVKPTKESKEKTTVGGREWGSHRNNGRHGDRFYYQPRARIENEFEGRSGKQNVGRSITVE